MYLKVLYEGGNKIENEKYRASITLKTQQISHLVVVDLKIEY